MQCFLAHIYNIIVADFMRNVMNNEQPVSIITNALLSKLHLRYPMLFPWEKNRTEQDHFNNLVNNYVSKHGRTNLTVVCEFGNFFLCLF